MSLQNTILIGLGYKARHGKDTVAAEIAARYKDQFDIKVYGFADALKAEVEELGAAAIAFKHGIPLDPNPDMTDPLCPSGKQSRVLQFWGEARRTAHPFYWVNKLREQIEKDQPKIAIVKDVRHLNELYFIKAFGGYTVKVSRNGFVDLSRDPNHVSETQLDGVQFDIEIAVEDGQLDQLKKDAVTTFELILAQYKPVDEVLGANNTTEVEATESLVALY